ncbi:TonB-dependent receptor [Halomonas urmiana]|uniref:TonB-dependent receptor n=1 Tax=Halomonas urmiana TaxID=490901 RepID=A0A5R8M6B0_9GAMM|nr:TonB-dependent receptor [Halomonas urmiana]TLF45084.1 TonB-dependent receptor [Halomonas urmiana]
MDSPKSDNDTLRARLDHAFSDTLRMENRLQLTTIDHVMDNYTQRRAAPERHRHPLCQPHQLDVGIERRLAHAGIELTAFADRVDDYIFRAETASGVSTYRNIDATLYGVELSGDLRWARHWETRGQLSWVRGDNLDDGGALADIAPLRGRLSQFHVREAWEAGLTARFSDARGRPGRVGREGSALERFAVGS